MFLPPTLRVAPKLHVHFAAGLLDVPFLADLVSSWRALGVISTRYPLSRARLQPFGVSCRRKYHAFKEFSHESHGCYQLISPDLHFVISVAQYFPQFGRKRGFNTCCWSMRPMLTLEKRRFQGQMLHLARWVSDSLALALRTALALSSESFELTDQLPGWIDWRQGLS